MAIYLDANPIIGWKGFGAIDRIVLALVAADLGMDVRIPQMAAEEVEGHQQRDLKQRIAALDSAAQAVTSLVDVEWSASDLTVPLEPAMDRWRAEFGEVGTIIAWRPEDLEQAFRREIAGVAPAVPRTGKPGAGRGGRDAAIWLAVVRDHRERSESGHFITADVSHMTGADGSLLTALADDLVGHDQPLRVWRSIAELVEHLGLRKTTNPMTPSELSEVATSAVASGLARSPAAGRAVYADAQSDWRFRTLVHDAAVERIVGTSVYEDATQRIRLVNAIWRLRAQCGVAPDPESDQGFSVSDVRLRGTIQTYVRTRGSEPPVSEFVAAQLTSSTHAFIEDDGLLVIG